MRAAGKHPTAVAGADIAVVTGDRRVDAAARRIAGIRRAMIVVVAVSRLAAEADQPVVDAVGLVKLCAHVEVAAILPFPGCMSAADDRITEVVGAVGVIAAIDLLRGALPRGGVAAVVGADVAVVADPGRPLAGDSRRRVLDAGVTQRAGLPVVAGAAGGLRQTGALAGPVALVREGAGVSIVAGRSGRLGRPRAAGVLVARVTGRAGVLIVAGRSGRQRAVDATGLRVARVGRARVRVVALELRVQARAGRRIAGVHRARVRVVAGGAGQRGDGVCGHTLFGRAAGSRGDEHQREDHDREEEPPTSRFPPHGTLLGGDNLALTSGNVKRSRASGSWRRSLTCPTCTSKGAACQPGIAANLEDCLGYREEAVGSRQSVK